MESQQPTQQSRAQRILSEIEKHPTQEQEPGIKAPMPNGSVSENLAALGYDLDRDGKFANFKNPLNPEKTINIPLQGKDGNPRSLEEMLFESERAVNRYKSVYNIHELPNGTFQQMAEKKPNESALETFGRSTGDASLDTLARISRFMPRAVTEAGALAASDMGAVSPEEAQDYIHNKKANDKAYNQVVEHGLYSQAGDMTTGYDKEHAEKINPKAAISGKLLGTGLDAAAQATFMGGLGGGGRSFASGAGKGYLTQAGEALGSKAGGLVSNPLAQKLLGKAVEGAVINVGEALPFNAVAGASDVAYADKPTSEAAKEYAKLTGLDAGFGALMHSGKLGKLLGFGAIGGMIGKGYYDSAHRVPEEDMIDKP